MHPNKLKVKVIGAGLAGSEAALVLARAGAQVELVEARPNVQTDVHKSGLCAELVCSNSFKSQKASSAAGMLKSELDVLKSPLYAAALKNQVPAGGALAVDRQLFAQSVTRAIEECPNIKLVCREATCVKAECVGSDALILATGPMTTDALAHSLQQLTDSEHLFFYDAAAPIVMADSLDPEKLFWQSRYEDGGVCANTSTNAQAAGEYLNAPFTKAEYDAFIEELTHAQKVIAKDFETRELFQACQPIEEIARKGHDAPRFGTLKPVGLTDPHTGRRPWAALQLRAEDANAQCFNLVGFQTNLTFPEQKRVFRMIPGLESAQFARFGVMHKNVFIDAPRLLDETLRLRAEGLRAEGLCVEGLCAEGLRAGAAASSSADAWAACAQDAGANDLPKTPIYIAGQLSGTEGYTEAIRSGAHAAISALAHLRGCSLPAPPAQTAFGALLHYACNPDTKDYQPMHVNFGIMPPLDVHIKQKKLRYEAYAKRGAEAMRAYVENLEAAGLV